VSLTCPTRANGTCNYKIDYVKALFPAGFDLPGCVFGECALSTQVFIPPVVHTSIWNGVSVAGVSIVTIVGAALFVFMGAAWWDKYKLRGQDSEQHESGLSVGFHDIAYTLGAKTILHSVTGHVDAGKCLAILGPSGAGKSTLLDILAGKLKTGEVGGSVLYGNHALSRSNVKFISGYVDQEDVLMATMTVRETLLFSANLRLPESMSADKKAAIVNEILEELGLSHVRDSFIGGANAMRGISGGERRRVSIGIELVTSPAVLYLDEPTSGLDSASAFQVVKVLARLAHTRGRTVIFTIHQPRSDMFALFDDVLLLAQGSTLYSGPATHALHYFESMGKPCPEGYNIADHLLDVAASTIPITEKVPLQSKHSLSNLLDSFRGGVEGLRSLQFWSRSGSRSSIKVADPIWDGSDSVRTSFLTQTWELMKRSSRQLWRQGGLLRAHLLMALLMGIFIGAIYYRSDNSLAGVQNRLGSFLFLLSVLGFSSMSAIGMIAEERTLWIRERSNGYYRIMPLFVSKVCVLFVIIVLWQHLFTWSSKSTGAL
jgi:ABC-type multidrug transport system ATPase subunit